MVSAIHQRRIDVLQQRRAMLEATVEDLRASGLLLLILLPLLGLADAELEGPVPPRSTLTFSPIVRADLREEINRKPIRRIGDEDR